MHEAAIAQLGERQTEDLEVPGSIPGYGIFRFKAFGRFARRYQATPNRDVVDQLSSIFVLTAPPSHTAGWRSG